MTSQDVIHSFFVTAFRTKQMSCRIAIQPPGSRLRSRANIICSAPSIAAPSIPA
jgi:hypothetical protein